VLMDVSLSGFRSIAEFVNAVLLLPMRFWSQWTMDRLIERTVHRGMVGTVAGTSIGKAIFTNLDFADDVALLAEMLSVLILALEVMVWIKKHNLWDSPSTGQRPRFKPPS